jgi:nucleolar GTP-binding protein
LIRLTDADWATDNVPEIMDGKNVADFFDPEIEARLDELEREETEMEQAAEEAAAMGASGAAGSDDWELDDDQQAVLGEIRRKKKLMRNEADLKGNLKKIVIPRTKKDRTLQEFESHLDSLGIDHAKLSARARGQDADDEDEDMDLEDADGGDQEEESVLGKRRGRSRSRGDESRAVSSSAAGRMASKSRERSTSRARSKSRPQSNAPAAGADGMRNVRAKYDVQKLTKKIQAKTFNLRGLQGESDRFIGTKMPRHLFSGKRGIGKTDRR